jgi:hypothetical protein
MAAEENINNVRPVERSIVTDFSDKMSYGSYRDLDRLLSSQHPVSEPEHHDEMLFIIQHQTTELWLKLVRHELASARHLFATDHLRETLKRLACVKQIQGVLTQQWAVLATLTPTEYAQFRNDLGNSSGSQSPQYTATVSRLLHDTAHVLDASSIQRNTVSPERCHQSSPRRVRRENGTQSSALCPWMCKPGGAFPREYRRVRRCVPQHRPRCRDRPKSAASMGVPPSVFQPGRRRP